MACEIKPNLKDFFVFIHKFFQYSKIIIVIYLYNAIGTLNESLGKGALSNSCFTKY